MGSDELTGEVCQVEGCGREAEEDRIQRQTGGFLSTTTFEHIELCEVCYRAFQHGYKAPKQDEDRMLQ